MRNRPGTRDDRALRDGASALRGETVFGLPAKLPKTTIDVARVVVAGQHPDRDPNGPQFNQEVLRVSKERYGTDTQGSLAQQRFQYGVDKDIANRLDKEIKDLRARLDPTKRPDLEYNAPPLEEQQRIIAQIQDLEAKKRTIDESLQGRSSLSPKPAPAAPAPAPAPGGTPTAPTAPRAAKPPRTTPPAGAAPDSPAYQAAIAQASREVQREVEAEMKLAPGVPATDVQRKQARESALLRVVTGGWSRSSLMSESQALRSSMSRSASSATCRSGCRGSRSHPR